MRYDGPPGLMLDLLGPSPDGLDIEWIHPYTYANNNPHRFVDPSGFQAAPAGNMPCHDCECEKCTVLMGGRDIIDVPDNRKCRVEITCQEGNCQGLPGSTGTPTLEKDDQGNPQWVIQVCVQCGWHPANLPRRRLTIRLYRMMKVESPSTKAAKLMSLLMPSNCGR